MAIAGSLSAPVDTAAHNPAPTGSETAYCASAEDSSQWGTAVLPSKDGWPRGLLVRSKAGRDKGHYYLVLSEEGSFVWLTDGRKRSVANPKRKNKLHLQRVNWVAADPCSRDDVATPTDEMIRAAITGMLLPKK